MGRIKQSFMKRIANDLLKKYRKEFSSDFNENKKAVQKFSTVESKSVRNKIAGYITRVIRQQS